MSQYIWLRYQNGATVTSRRVKAQVVRTTPEARVEAGTTLREMDYEHLRSKRNVYPMTIGASELRAPASFAFMNEFWTAEQRWIALSESATEPLDAEFVAVNRGGGLAPIDFLDGAGGLPSYSLTLTEKYPR